MRHTPFKTLVTALLAAGLAGCTPTATVVIQTPPPKPPQKVALVLGGGGARGFAHVGVLRELEAARVPIDLIVGTSVGSLIGVMYADTRNSLDLEWKAFQIQKDQIFDFKVINWAEGLAKGEALGNYVRGILKAKNLEELSLPVAVVAADLQAGRPVVFTRGSIAAAVRASAALPGIFPPVRYQNTWLVDGGVLGNLAPKAARDLGATVVIGVDVGKSQRPAIDNPNVINIILDSVDLMGGEIVRLNQDKFDAMIAPDVGAYGITDFNHKKEMMEIGQRAAREAIPRIQALLQTPAAPPLTGVTSPSGPTQ